MSYLKVTARPGAEKNKITGFNQWRGSLEVDVAAVARKNKANRELEGFLSRVFGQRVDIVKGVKSPQKTIFVPLEETEVRRIISNYI